MSMSAAEKYARRARNSDSLEDVAYNMACAIDELVQEIRDLEGMLRGCCCRRATRCQNNTNSRWAIDARTVASCGRCRLLDTRSHDDHWTKCRHPETAHNTVSSYDCTVR